MASEGCTDDEYRSHFGLWCMQAAPLILGCDVRSMDDATKGILLNRELIAVNQDQLGAQAVCLGTHWRSEVWAKPLSGGDVVVGFFNLQDKPAHTVPVAWEQLHLHDRRPCRVTDLWMGEDLGRCSRVFNSGPLEPHGCQIVRIAPERD